MSQHRRFKIRSLEQLREHAQSLGVEIPIQTDLDVLGQPLALAGHTLSNRFMVQPMEGFDADVQGGPGPLAFRRYRRYAAGGAALIWFEATAVLHEGRSNPGQFCLNAATVAAFQRLVAETRQAGREATGREPVLILQLTHSGRYSKPSGVPQPIIAHHSPILDPRHNLPADYPLVTDAYLDQLQDHFVTAAGLAAQAGFDGVDVKSCHRYLFSELLASHTREGKYGGSFQNRTRLLCETLERIKAAQPALFVTTRMNAYDAMSYPYGFGVNQEDYLVPDLAEPLLLVGKLQKLGVALLNISIGNPYFNPHFGRPYDFPIAGVQPPAEAPLAGISRFVQITRTIQEAYPELPIVGSGYGWLRQFMPNVAAGILTRGWASLIGQGRGSFAYPDSVRDILNNGAMQPQKCCVTCSACTQIMRDGGRTGCVVHDSQIYGPQYRIGRRFSVDRLISEAQRCRDCEQASCSRGCPAHLDVPGFIKAFANSDIATAYEIMRRNNVLPEMCGFVCPAEEQCQGQCLENTFCEQSIPIQDIQLVVAQAARLQGLTAARLPESATGKQVAVVGGGPAGLACALQLLEAGHTVTLFEKSSQLGGVPQSTIPAARFASAQAEVDAIFQGAQAKQRLMINYNSPLGDDLQLDTLRQRFDATFLAVGLSSSTSLGKADGVMDALTFLAQAKSGKLSAMPKRVAVLGAGNTAMDAATTALRLNTRDAYIVYRRSFAEMPAWPKERAEFLEAGGHLLVLTQPLGYETDPSGKLTALRVARTELGSPDKSGRRRPEVIPNSESLLAVDMVIEALGQQVDSSTCAALAGLEFTAAGRLAVAADTLATNLAGVYAGGDAVNGGSTAVQGIVDGMQAAKAINQMLQNRV